MPRLGSGIPLVARAAEIARLRASLARAEAGSAGAMIVSGDAGVGKSRLLEELGRAAEARDALVLSGRCLDVGETGLPYLPFVEILVQLNRTDPDSVRHWPALARLLPESSMPAQPEPASNSPRPGSPVAAPERDLGQLQLFDALIGLLTDLSSRRCVVLLVEDLHWADSSTRDLVSFLLSRLRTQRLLVVASYRSDDLHRRHPLRPMLAELVRLPAVERIDLEPFDMADSRRFVTALAEEPLSDDMIRQIAERSEGNAFFAEELMAACADHEDGVPTGLADVLLARIERLAPATQRVIRLASVGGRRVRHSRLQAVAAMNPDELDEALREAVQHHVLVVDDGADVYSFRHALLREAVYGDLLPGERVRLHADYARYIADDEEGRRGAAAALAHHSLQSHDLRTALLASVRAADEAAMLGAPAESLRHFEQALKLWDGVEPTDRPAGITEAVLLRKASYAAGTAGQPEHAIAYARSAVDRFASVEQPEDAAQSYRRLAQALVGVDNRGSEAREAIENAWELVRNRPASYTRAWVLAVLAMALRRGDPAAAKVAATDAIKDARAVRALGAEADALITLGMLDEYEGNYDDAVGHFTDAIDTAVRVQAFTTELRARFFLGLHHYDHGDLDRAVAEFTKASERAKANGMSWSNYGIDIRIYLATSLFMVGDWDASEAALEQRGRPMSMSDTVLARLASASAFVMVGRGRFDEAEKLLTALRAHWHRDGDIVIYGGFAAAEMGVWRGRPEDTATAVADVSAWLRKASWTWMLGRIRLVAWGIAAQVELARRARRDRDVTAELAAVAEGERMADEADEVATAGRPWTGKMGLEGQAWLAMVRAERTRLAGLGGDPAAWRAAVEAFGYGSVYQQAVARLRLAETLLAVDERAAATAELTEVVTVANRLGAKPLGDAAAELARRGRLAVAGLAPARDEVDPFTPRERAVLALVALGRTNRQVGQELYISEKTVSVHLSRIMAKLGASRRAEAVATAYERGLLDHSSSR